MKCDLAIWTDANGDMIAIGDEECKEGDSIVIVKLNHENIIAWIKALVGMLDDGDLINVPGEIGQCTKDDQGMEVFVLIKERGDEQD